MQANSRKTHCPQGHPYDAENTAYYQERRYCRECHRKYGREWARKKRAQERDAHNDYQRAWREGNPDKVAAYRKRNNAYMRGYRYIKEYGLTLGQRAGVFEESDGFCAVCYEEPAEAIDHDHRTGQVRGALCHSCNRGLGDFKDDPDRLRAALEYLESPRLEEVS